MGTRQGVFADIFLGTMKIESPMQLDPSHQDAELLSRLERSLYESAGGKEIFQKRIPEILRQAIDEVIDPARTKRFTLDEIEKTEKTYLGTKVEILFRNFLKLEHGGTLDLIVDGVKVDVKNTIGSTWTIPNEAVGHPCILIRTNEKWALCSLGLIVIRPEILNVGRNRDAKTTIKATELKNVHWLLRDAPYPPNFWLGLEPGVRLDILRPRGGTDRLAMLFRKHLGLPISRNLVVALAQQDDPMKRLRRNGGARDQLAPEGIALLSGRTHSSLFSELGLKQCDVDEFISYKPERQDHIDLLRQVGEID